MGYTEAFEEILGYKFNDIKLLEQALSHSSYANEKKLASGSNERLEFLGDSVLSIVVSDYIYKNLNVPEGELTKLRASLVCEKSLYVFAKQIHLGDFLFLGKGEENTGENAPLFLQMLLRRSLQLFTLTAEWNLPQST